ncbi:hypothetical protein [Trinickia symbiotica]|uniref:Uncharacterized protein n=1 Tax=Trinickia symbiotica TaxID=863227 RepID=A0A2N7XAU5_9BURK|nr:hypothetical protein [Trinickia symbiotica]PMS38858.1 hypothetical protein C0Z20_00930 [Trinickia symbiotica]
MIDRKGDGLPKEKPTLDANPGFAALGGMAAEIDSQAEATLNPGAAQAAADAAANAPDYLRGASGIVDLVSAMLDGYAPGAGWKDDQRARMAASVAPVLEKYGFDIESSVPCELVALMVCGPALYQSAKIVALKIQSDRIALARAARGLDDPSTVKGAARAESGQPAASQGSADVSAEAALAEAVAGAPVFPVM